MGPPIFVRVCGTSLRIPEEESLVPSDSDFKTGVPQPRAEGRRARPPRRPDVRGSCDGRGGRSRGARGLTAPRPPVAVGRRAGARVPCAHRRAGRRSQPRRGPGVGQRVGAGVRGGRARSGGGRGRAARAGRCAATLRDPDRAEGPLCRRREAAHRVEPGARRASCALVRRLDASRGGGDGPPRPPPHARVRVRRDDRPGRQPVVPRTFGRWLERRLRRGARVAPGTGGDRHGHGRLAPHPVRGMRHVDRQAHPRSAPAPGRRAARAELRPRGADGPHG